MEQQHSGCGATEREVVGWVGGAMPGGAAGMGNRREGRTPPPPAPQGMAWGSSFHATGSCHFPRQLLRASFLTVLPGGAEEAPSRASGPDPEDLRHSAGPARRFRNAGRPAGRGHFPRNLQGQYFLRTAYCVEPDPAGGTAETASHGSLARGPAEKTRRRHARSHPAEDPFLRQRRQSMKSTVIGNR